jgi:alkanesulfonate monooxygenase SsuD/methylene tetrahydromethanopterin reductase-like flavin-dependent oxidoreductase (luciferase family)
VKFGIFYEHQLPRPWTDDSEHQLIQDALEQVELADRLGFDVAWEVEHHFLEEYSHSSAPEVFLAAASQRTRDIRLGHGIIQTAPAYNHPARTAERLAMLDLVSNGRVEFGSGESSSEAELAGFLIDPALKREMWLEGLEVAIRCMTEEPFTGVDGTYVSMPPRNVVPKPVQKPHPPLWVACSRRDTILLAAEKGIGALTFAFIDPEEASQWIGDYERTLSEGGNFFGYSLAHYYVFGEHRPGTTDVWAEYVERRDEKGFSPEAAAQALEEERLGAKLASEDATGLRGAVGTPDQIREYLRRYEEAGVDQVIFVMQAGKNRHDHICEALELFGREVLPEFKERDEAITKAKAERLAPVVEAALARRTEPEGLMPEGYCFPAIPRRMVDESGNPDARKWLEQIAEDRAHGKRDPSFGIAG